MSTVLDRPGTTADPMLARRYRVQRRHVETRDTVTLLLEPVDAPVAAPAPGQFTMLYAFGVGEVPISVSGHASETDGLLMHTLRSVGPVTHALYDARPGTVLGVRGPFGTDWGVDAALGHDVVVMAGGIGLAPLRPVLVDVLARRAQFGRVVLLLGARTPDELLFRRDLHTWRSRFDVEVEVTVDRAAAGWRGHVGLVTTLVPRAPFDPQSTVGFVCGPEVMMRYGAEALAQRGVPAGNIRLSLERNMKCAVALCGHCQLGPLLVCRDGPVFSYDHIARLLTVREL